MAKNLYEYGIGMNRRIACAVAEDHGKPWHESETRAYRVPVDSSSTLEEWKHAAGMDDARQCTYDPCYASGDTRVQLDQVALVERWADGHIVHTLTPKDDLLAVNPAVFAEQWWRMRERAERANPTGKAECSTLMRLGEKNGSTLVGAILLGDVDFGAGDRGAKFLTLSTSYDKSESTMLSCSSYRSVCANMFAANLEEASRTGRKFELRGGPSRVGELISQSAIDDAVTWINSMFAAQEKKMKALKQAKVTFGGSAFLDLLRKTGKESGALKPVSRKERDTNAAFMSRAQSEFVTEFGRAGADLVATIVEQSQREAELGIEDCFGTGFGIVQGIEYLATRKGEDRPGSALMGMSRSVTQALTA